MDGDARRGRDALRPSPLDGDRPKEQIEILSFEATLTASVAEKAAAVVDLAYRLRIMGSLALSLCHLAAGRIDAVCSLKPARAVDIAAAQLLVLERGLAIELPEAPPFATAPLDLEGRSRVVAAGTPDLCRQLAAALGLKKTVKLSSPDRVLYPDDGITKGDVFEYYQQVGADARAASARPSVHDEALPARDHGRGRSSRSKRLSTCRAGSRRASSARGHAKAVRGSSTLHS